MKTQTKILLWEQGIQTYCIKLAGYLWFTNSICMKLQKMPPAWEASLMTEKVCTLRVCLFVQQTVHVIPALEQERQENQSFQVKGIHISTVPLQASGL